MHCQPTGPSPPTALPALSPLHSLSLVLPLLFFLICNYFFFSSRTGRIPGVGVANSLVPANTFLAVDILFSAKEMASSPCQGEPPKHGDSFHHSRSSRGAQTSAFLVPILLRAPACSPFPIFPAQSTARGPSVLRRGISIGLQPSPRAS